MTILMTDSVKLYDFLMAYCPGGVLNFELGTDVRPEVSTTTL